MKGKVNMDRMEGLRAGVAEMRSVAQKLMAWADDLEQSVQNQKTTEPEVFTAGVVQPSGRKKSGTGKTSAAKQLPEPASAKEGKSLLSLLEVRGVLAEKCAAGFSTQVKALIESYGVSTLKEVPPEKYVSALMLTFLFDGSRSGDLDPFDTIDGRLSRFKHHLVGVVC